MVAKEPHLYSVLPTLPIQQFMIIGVPKEIKVHEYRVAILPFGVDEFVQAGHTVLVQRDGGIGAGIPNEEYERAGAKIIDTAEEIFAKADIIMKVKEPQPQEVKMLRKSQILFTYLHLAADQKLTEGIINSGCRAIAYETIVDHQGHLPLLTPMSEVAGRLSIQEGARHLCKSQGGRGVLLCGVPGVAPGKVVVIGGGIAGSCAARVAAGFGANVVILDTNIDRLRYLSDVMPSNVDVVFSNRHEIHKQIAEADLVIGAVLIPGAKAPHLIRREDLKLMQPGSVIVDIAIDQGGCVETARPTTHAEPTYVVDGIIHYCVANMPGAVSRTSTAALCNATFPWAKEIARFGDDLVGATEKHSQIAHGINAFDGELTCKPVADSFGLPWSDRFVKNYWGK